jgi:hypothetical protein
MNKRKIGRSPLVCRRFLHLLPPLLIIIIILSIRTLVILVIVCFFLLLFSLFFISSLDFLSLQLFMHENHLSMYLLSLSNNDLALL